MRRRARERKVKEREGGWVRDGWGNEGKREREGGAEKLVIGRSSFWVYLNLSVWRCK